MVSKKHGDYEMRQKSKMKRKLNYADYLLPRGASDDVMIPRGAGDSVMISRGAGDGVMIPRGASDVVIIVRGDAVVPANRKRDGSSE